VYTATLLCGSVLTYETPSFAPSKGDVVPCRHHGYCVVARRGRAQSLRSPRRSLPRARPRQRYELLEWLDSCPVTTVAALRSQRFTLRLIADAEREGLLSVDGETGAVVSTASRALKDASACTLYAPNIAVESRGSPSAVNGSFGG
jgi:hypothetical protein